MKRTVVQPSPKEPNMDISLAAWSVNRRVRREQQPTRLLSLPAICRHEFGIDKLELVSTFFAHRDTWYVDELRACADGEGVTLLNIAIDACGNLSAADNAERQTAVDQHAAWFPIAQTLGCSAVRANTGGQAGDQDALARCTDSFAKLAEQGRQHGITMMVENHGGLATDPEAMIQIVQQVGQNIGTLPDFGNFPIDRLYDGLTKIMPFAVAVHAKMFRHIEPEAGKFWDEKDGQRREVDCKRCLQIVKDGGYRGPLGIEYGGGEEDHEGVLRAKRLLELHAC